MDLVSTIMSGVKLAIAAAPEVEKIVVAAKKWLDALFSAGLISKDVQNATHAHVDALAEAAAAGQELPSWSIEPDPT